MKSIIQGISLGVNSLYEANCKIDWMGYFLYSTKTMPEFDPNRHEEIQPQFSVSWDGSRCDIFDLMPDTDTQVNLLDITIHDISVSLYSTPIDGSTSFRLSAYFRCSDPPRSVNAVRVLMNSPLMTRRGLSPLLSSNTDAGWSILSSSHDARNEHPTVVSISSEVVIVSTEYTPHHQERDTETLNRFFNVFMKLSDAIQGVGRSDNPVEYKSKQNYAIGYPDDDVSADTPDEVSNEPVHLVRSLHAEVPSVRFDDFAGLDKQIRELQEPLSLFYRPDIVEKYGLNPERGVILYGPPGTGKSSVAEAAASYIQARFVRIQPTDIFDMYVGQSEVNIRSTFDAIREYDSPLVVILDEIDTMLARTHANAGVGRGVNVAFRNAIDALPSNVFVIGTTNNLDEVDSAARRAGRLSRKIEFATPDYHARAEIIRAIIGARVIDFILQDVAAPEHYFSENSAPLDIPLFATDVNVQEIIRNTDEMSGATLKDLFDRLIRRMAIEEAMTGREPQRITMAAIMAEISRIRHDTA